MQMPGSTKQAKSVGARSPPNCASDDSRYSAATEPSQTNVVEISVVVCHHVHERTEQPLPPLSGPTVTSSAFVHSPRATVSAPLSVSSQIAAYVSGGTHP